jgi:N-formylglutamate amidohydrolase
MTLIAAAVLWCFTTTSLLADDELLVIHQGDLPIVISAPHGGTLQIPEVPPRQGDHLESGPAGFRAVRDGGTEELALAVAAAVDERLEGSPSWIVSRVHRRYVDFNRPPEIGVEHPRARVVYDQYHAALQDAVRRIRQRGQYGLLIDLHGQGSSAATVYRGTSNGLTVTSLRDRTADAGQTSSFSLPGRLKSRGWTVHPDPFDGKEQSGFTGGHIVRTYGSHRPDGIDAIQLELGANYRKAADRVRVSGELTEAILEFAGKYLELNLQSSAAGQ